MYPVYARERHQNAIGSAYGLAELDSEMAGQRIVCVTVHGLGQGTTNFLDIGNGFGESVDISFI